MKPLTCMEICKGVNGKLYSKAPESLVTGISIDSRTVKEGELFIPIQGETLDGHDFIKQAMENGCSCVFIGESLGSEKTTALLDAEIERVSFILCKDTTKALQDLARYYLSTFQIKKVGITGSTGKTTTKDMVYHICSEKFNTARNLGNFNNHIGLPLTILGFEEGTQVGILEMGMSEKGEIDLLAELVRPDIGVITNIGTAHIENLGSRQGILEAKMEITNYFDENNVLILNRDTDLFQGLDMSCPYKLVTVGENGKSDFILSNIADQGESGITFTIEHKQGIDYESQDFQLSIPGRHNAFNSGLAVAVGVQLGVSLEEAARGLRKMVETDKRLSMKGSRGIKIIDDTYNASVDSMKSGLDVLENVFGMRKIAVLGDMLEMGDKSPEFHQEVGEYLADKKLDLLITVGEASLNIQKGAMKSMPVEQMRHYRSKEELIREIRELVKPGDVVLLKGSRGMKLDQVVKHLMEE